MQLIRKLQHSVLHAVLFPYVCQKIYQYDVRGRRRLHLQPYIHTVDHNLGSIRDNSWVNGNSVTGAGNSTGAGTSAPTCRTVAAWAVAGGLKNTKGNQMGSWFFSGFGGFCFLLP